jgi:hypothetical protein
MGAAGRQGEWIRKMEKQSDTREEAARAMHWAIRQAIDGPGPARDRAWLAVTYVQEALASEGLMVVRKGQVGPKKR